MAVISGDGDLMGIGGNHFIHAARRNMDLLVILVNNFIYGMTGGQNAPTTPLTARSSTMPLGNFERPFNLPHLAATCGATYVARWTSMHTAQMTRTFTEALKRKGFRFIEVIAPCSTLYARLNKLGDGLDLMTYYRDNFEIKNKADTRELDLDFQSKIICREVRGRGAADVPRGDGDALPQARSATSTCRCRPEGGMLHGQD